MRRNRLEEMKKNYFKNLTIKKINPWLLYYKCDKCGDEFCREPMYVCIEPGVNTEFTYHYYGCSHCFNSKDEFHKYLEDNKKILVEDDFKEFNIKLLF